MDKVVTIKVTKNVDLNKDAVVALLEEFVKWIETKGIAEMYYDTPSSIEIATLFLEELRS